jgi:hypothetical protein
MLLFLLQPPVLAILALFLAWSVVSLVELLLLLLSSSR